MKRGILASIVLTMASVATGQVFHCPNDVDTYLSFAFVDASGLMSELKAADITCYFGPVTDSNTVTEYSLVDGVNFWEMGVAGGDGIGRYRIMIGESEFTETDSQYDVYLSVNATGETVSLRVQTPHSIANEFYDVVSSGEATVEDAVATALDTYDAATGTDVVTARFDPNTTPVQVSTTAVTAIQSGVLAAVVDGTVTLEDVMQCLLAFMAGKATIVDNGSTWTITFYLQDNTTPKYNVTSSETDGSRTTGGTIDP
jgi:hypothetical protein